jgi:hypothetical protein
MRKWIVRFVSLLVFNIVVLLLIGFLTPARVGWAALWAGTVMTALVIWVKPLIHSGFRSMAAKSGKQRSRTGAAAVEFALVLAVAAIVWILTVVFTGVSVRGWLWGYLLPPVIIAIGWAVYAVIDDRVEARTGALYDRATRRRATDASVGSVPAVPSASRDAGRRELKDGLTAEQRRMLDELG